MGVEAGGEVAREGLGGGLGGVVGEDEGAEGVEEEEGALIIVHVLVLEVAEAQLREGGARGREEEEEERGLGAQLGTGGIHSTHVAWWSLEMLHLSQRMRGFICSSRNAS